MSKRSKKKKKRAYKQKQAFYNQVFNSETKPGEIRKIAFEVFGSTYFTVQDMHKGQ